MKQFWFIVAAIVTTICVIALSVMLAPTPGPVLT